MFEDKHQQALSTYSNLMVEARSRLSWIEHIAGGKTGLDAVVARESAYLQIRLTCELIALGCLVAHGDIEGTQTPKLQKQWSASAIFVELEKLHPDFFPNPRQLKSVGPGQWHFDHVAHDYLDKERFIALYGRTGDVLHRGNLKGIVSGKNALVSDLAPVRAEFEALLGLLLIHEMALLNGDRFVCQLNNADGLVQVLVGARTPE